MTTCRIPFFIGGLDSNYLRGHTAALHVAGDADDDADIGASAYSITEVDGHGYYVSATTLEPVYDLVIDGVKDPVWRRVPRSLFLGGGDGQITVEVLEDVQTGQGVAAIGVNSTSGELRCYVANPTDATRWSVVGVFLEDAASGATGVRVRTFGVETGLPDTYPSGHRLVIGYDGFVVSSLEAVGGANIPTGQDPKIFIGIGLGTGKAWIQTGGLV